MNDCLGEYVRNEEKFEVFKAERLAEIEASRARHKDGLGAASVAAVAGAAGGSADKAKAR